MPGVEGALSEKLTVEGLTEPISGCSFARPIIAEQISGGPMLGVEGIFLAFANKLCSPCSEVSLGCLVISGSPVLAVKGAPSIAYLGHEGLIDSCNESPMVLSCSMQDVRGVTSILPLEQLAKET
jgi:hypothetical protein